MAKHVAAAPRFVAAAPKGMVPASVAGQWEAESARFSGNGSGVTSARTSEGRLALARKAAQARRDSVSAVAVVDEPPEIEEEAEEEQPAALDLDAALDAAEARASTSPMIDHAIKAFQEAAQAAPVDELTLAPVSDEDIDRLWDWLRSPADEGQAFLHLTFTTSRQLAQVIAAMQQQAFLEAIYFGAHHIGFLAVVPRVENTGVFHLYLEPRVRGQIAALTKELLPLVEQRFPGLQLAVYSASEAWARLHRQVLGPLGFREHTLFVR